MRARILVVDDDAKITSMLKRALTYEGYDVEIAANGHQALALAANNPDLIILDIMLPGIDGLAVCRQIRSNSDIPILMLTARDDTADRVLGLDTGADDYLVKPFALEELLARIRALLRRRSRETEAEVLQFSDLTLNTSTREGFRGQRSFSLTAKEYELLLYFLQNPHRVLTRDELMTRIWGYDFSGESNVLEVYIGYLRAKLEAGGEPRLIQTVRGVGYVLKEQQP
ncbi:response regulator transcription factor [Neomoorella thermoacetica]|uniref:Stage 0 sporulation protein A homolog n=2 Tax=Neomoorella thermoacetica TaxID=1525 RepID=A0A1D7XA56_NEOTH|nr:response regulator transcription factor [Moorella thermoacetica]AKX93895.1 response regulator MprA [Moorella thermoacetica]AKX96536.1 response regulator MprA [Moorella thermoacetica]AOQ23813.1 Response regulator MprA [Moorella thermoacetica]APC08271.1 response regulator MprA [Moorella thermoacetica]OIQ08912.1 response regulator MprA [Moorella thermoacetica]